MQKFSVSFLLKSRDIIYNRKLLHIFIRIKLEKNNRRLTVIKSLGKNYQIFDRDNNYDELQQEQIIVKTILKQIEAVVKNEITTRRT